MKFKLTKKELKYIASAIPVCSDIRLYCNNITVYVDEWIYYNNYESYPAFKKGFMYEYFSNVEDLICFEQNLKRLNIYYEKEISIGANFYAKIEISIYVDSIIVENLFQVIKKGRTSFMELSHNIKIMEEKINER